MRRRCRCRDSAPPTRTSRPMRSSGAEYRAKSTPRPGMSSRSSQMRQVMRKRGDFLLAEGICDIGHRRAGAPGPDARLVVVERLDQIFLALAGEPGNRFGPGIAVGVT